MGTERDKLKKIIDDNPQPEQIEGEPTVFDPMDMYICLYKNPEQCSIFHVYTVEQVDNLVKSTYLKEYWPKHLKE